jgi:hypothetical protein
VSKYGMDELMLCRYEHAWWHDINSVTNISFTPMRSSFDIIMLYFVCVISNGIRRNVLSDPPVKSVRWTTSHCPSVFECPSLPFVLVFSHSSLECDRFLFVWSVYAPLYYHSCRLSIQQGLDLFLCCQHHNFGYLRADPSGILWTCVGSLGPRLSCRCFHQSARGGLTRDPLLSWWQLLLLQTINVCDVYQQLKISSILLWGWCRLYRHIGCWS